MFGRHVGSQLYRIVLQKKRKPFRWAAEFFVPIVLLLALTGIKYTSDPESSEAKSYVNESDSIPTVDNLVNFPLDLQPANLTSGAWYVTHLDEFVNHGGSNIAVSCDTSNVEDLIDLQALCDVNLKWAIIPQNKNDILQNQLASDFEAYLTSQYPVLIDQNRIFTNVTDESELESYIESQDYGSSSEFPRIGAAIVFINSLGYKIRVNETASYGGGPPKENVPRITKNSDSLDTLERGTTDFTSQYFISGFLTLQKEVDQYVMKRRLDKEGGSGSDLEMDLEISLLAMPTFQYNVDPFWDSSSGVFGLFIVLLVLYPLAMMLQAIVKDKELKLRQLMFTVGLKPLAYTLSYFIYYVIFFTLLAVILTGLSKINLFTLSAIGVVFLYFWFAMLATMAYGFFIASLFERTTLATIVGLLVYCVGYFLYIPLADPDSSLGAQVIVSLIPSAAISFGTISISEYEGSEVGLSFDNLGEASQTDYTMGVAIGMLFFDTLLFMLLSLYFDAVLPSSGGKARLPWYLFRCGCGGSKARGDFEKQAKEQAEIEALNASNSNGMIQEVPAALNELREMGQCVMISNLCRSFKTPNGVLDAVKDVSMSFFEGEITVLLGANGAGKSTTINMITGMLNPTGGNLWISGKSALTDMNEIRSKIGVCPQQNILFPELTVREHMYVFAGIKGVAKDGLGEAIDHMIAEVGLTPKMYTKSRALSGGQKRKLQLAIALFGDSKLVLLDEPSSGMDPLSRKLTQQTIKRHRANRAILLTTHYMDEADLLGDRIAIMGNGQLRCLGTGMFLKERFGVGYQLVLEHRNQSGDEGIESIESIVHAHVPEAQKISEVGAELVFQIPLGASAVLQAMLAELEDQQEHLKISDVGVSVTSLDKVFMHVARGEDPREELRAGSTLLSDSQAQPDGDSTSTDAKSAELDGSVRVHVAKELPSFEYAPASATTHFKALFRKRFLYTKRDQRAWCCQLIIPILFLLLGFIAMQASSNSERESITFNAQLDDWNQAPLSNPVPFNVGDGDSVSFANTSFWMDSFDMPRIDRSQNFTVGPTGPFCIDANWINKRSREVANFVNRILRGNGGQTIDESVIAFLTRTSYGSLVCTDQSDFVPAATAFSGDLASSLGLSASSRFGASLFNVVPSNYSTFPTDVLRSDYTIVYNFTAIHAAPQMQNRINSALLESYVPGASITMIAQALPQTKAESDISAGFSAFSATLALGIAFAFVPATYAVFIVREKFQKSWHQQLINGVSPWAYWVSNWMFDFVTYLVPMFIAWILMWAFNLEPFLDEFGIVALIFVLYGISVTSFTYCLTYMFAEPSYAQFGIITINLLGAMILLVVSFVMFFLETTYEINDVLQYIYRILPPFAFTHGLLQVSNLPINNFVLNDKERGGDPSNPIDYGVWDLEIAGADVLFLALGCVFYTALLALLQYSVRGGVCHLSGLRCCKCKGCCGGAPTVIDDDQENGTKPPKQSNANSESPQEEDVDVAAERARIEAVDPTKDGADVAILQHLRKVYPGSSALAGDTIAVKDLSFGIHNNECFGLLGHNGAGKTTTLGMLTGEHYPTSGSVYIGGHNMVTDSASAQRKFGFCPQFDAIFDNLTGREHLMFYGKVKGIPANVLPTLIDQKLDDFTLTPHADRLAGSYSGGNKRKLSIAMATLGKPSVVFLDEPTAGVDLQSRRAIWERLSLLTKETSIILTTHLMEECEALCQRIGILVDGSMSAIGTAQHLKSRFGASFQLEIAFYPPSKQELQQIATDSGTSLDQLLTKEQIIELFEKLQLGDLYRSEFTATGSAQLLLQRLTLGIGKLSTSALAEWLVTEKSFLKARELLSERFPGLQVVERNGLRVKFSLPRQDDLPLSQMFGIVESTREPARIESVALGQTTLEEVFNSFAADSETMGIVSE